MDRHWTDHHASVGSIVRYADDMVLICRSQIKAEQALSLIRRLLDGLQLRLHPTKTRLVSTEREGFDFLGFHFHKWKSRMSGKLVPYMWPGVQAMKTIRRRIRQLTQRSGQRLSLAEIVTHLNPVIRGWRNYFRIGNASKKLQDLDRYVRGRLWLGARLRRQRSRSLDKTSFKHWLKHCGMAYFYAQE